MVFITDTNALQPKHVEMDLVLAKDRQLFAGSDVSLDCRAALAHVNIDFCGWAEAPLQSEPPDLRSGSQNTETHILPP